MARVAAIHRQLVLDVLDDGQPVLERQVVPGGIAVPRTPRVIVRIRSPSVGSGPLTRRNLNTASWKLRGRNLYMNVAAGPLPSPVTPWQPAQRRS